MKITRKNSFIELIHNGEIIESYKLDEAIDLKLLVEFLLKDELSSIFIVEDLVDNQTNPEKDLIALIKDIIDKYNIRKLEFDKFLGSK
jgi:hypothetical protein